MLIIFDGNCQAHHLAAIFEASGLAECVVNGRDFGTIPAFRGKLARYADESTCLTLMTEAKAIGRICVQATQSTPWSDATLTLYSPLADHVVRFPYLHCNIYLGAREPVAGRNYRRLYEADLDVIGLCQQYARSVFDFRGFIEAEQRHRPLFHMHVHPGAALVAALVRDVGRQIEAIDPREVDRVADEMARGEGINIFTQHPFAKSVLATLGFQWNAAYDSYAAMIDAYRRHDWPAIIAGHSRYETAFSNETQFWFPLFQAAVVTGHDALVAEAFERLTMLSPGFPELWVMMYGYKARCPQSLLDRAQTVFAGQRLLDYVLCRAATLRGDHGNALMLGERFLAASPDLNDGFIPLMLALLGAGKTELARNCASQFLDASDELRRPEIEAIMANYPETKDRAAFR